MEKPTPAEQLENHLIELQRELEGKEAGFICYEHKKMLFHFMQTLKYIGMSNPGVFKHLDQIKKEFFESLLRAQKMGERMEKGLRDRKNFLIRKRLELEYNEQKPQ